jgi:hypothetical protein
MAFRTVGNVVLVRHDLCAATKIGTRSKNASEDSGELAMANHGNLDSGTAASQLH